MVKMRARKVSWAPAAQRKMDSYWRISLVTACMSAPDSSSQSKNTARPLPESGTLAKTSTWR